MPHQSYSQQENNIPNEYDITILIPGLKIISIYEKQIFTDFCNDENLYLEYN